MYGTAYALRFHNLILRVLSTGRDHRDLHTAHPLSPLMDATGAPQHILIQCAQRTWSCPGLLYRVETLNSVKNSATAIFTQNQRMLYPANIVTCVSPELELTHPPHQFRSANNANSRTNAQPTAATRGGSSRSTGFPIEFPYYIIPPRQSPPTRGWPCRACWPGPSDPRSCSRRRPSS
jgi:hypothetical protein